ncbi:hypothetical protein F751_1214 [Auxenochlorella protothecoides]|uniref:Senescence domain-containing protein n=1 Tax=Auxenochlorella protothecoides TaxID=3075 RepID=A0A087SNY3_AUXPR|nr:hypothetical protein F751_1214 [Auxenochlorella protothecoides]KFM27437.1 hypothetical protein F751_1214 [Auxenochlorella protothecoides]
MSEVLISFPYAELYIVRGSEAPILQSEGELVISSSPGTGDAAEQGPPASCIQLAVGKVSWEVKPSSKALKAGEYTWVFSTSEAGIFYSLTLLASASEEDVGIFEAVLENIAVVKESEALLADPEAQHGEAALAGAAYNSALARGVHRASAGLASGLLVSAAYATGAIKRATKRRFERTAAAAEWASGAAGAVVGGLAWVGAKVAGGALWALGADKPLAPGEEAGVLRETSHAAAAGFSQVWEGMEDAGRAVLLSARDGAAGVVGDRYGADAAGLSLHSMNAAGSGANAVYAVRKLGVRTVAKAAAKQAPPGAKQQQLVPQGKQA